MLIYRAQVYLATPNEEGKKIDFTSDTVLKEILAHIHTFNSTQTKKILKISNVAEGFLKIYMFAKTDSLYLNERDFEAFNDILCENGWLKYSKTGELLSAFRFEKMDLSLEKFAILPVLPDEYNYIWLKDYNDTMTNEQTIDLLKSLFILAEKEKIVSKATNQKYRNALYKIKKVLGDAFNQSL